MRLHEARFRVGGGVPTDQRGVILAVREGGVVRLGDAVLVEA